MPFFNYKCTKCEHTDEFLVGNTTGNTAPTDCPVCEEKDCMEKTTSYDGVSGEVVGGYEYNYGRKSWKRTGTMAEKAGILAGTQNPYK